MRRALLLTTLLVAGCGGSDAPEASQVDVERAVTEARGGVAWKCEKDDANERKWNCRVGDTAARSTVTVNDDGSFTVE